MSVSWFVVVTLGHGAGLHLPFVRTAVPALWLAVVGVVAAFPRGRLAYAGVVLLTPAVVSSAVMWTNAVRNGDWHRVSRASRNDVLFGTTPVTIRDVASINADRLDCADYDTWVCRLVAPSLAGVTVVTEAGDVQYDPNLRCALGTRRPPDPFQVNVYRAGELVGVLCH
jgi:hypothetical protein